MKFTECEVGMTVIGNEKADGAYSITRTGWVGTITSINIRQKHIEVRSKADGAGFWVDPVFFDLFELETVTAEDFFKML